MPKSIRLRRDFYFYVLRKLKPKLRSAGSVALNSPSEEFFLRKK